MSTYADLVETLQPYDKDDPRVKQALEWGEILLTEIRGPKVLEPTTGENIIHLKGTK
jgi:hypothetical protein